MESDVLSVPPSPRLTPTLLGATLAAALAGLLFGFDTAVIAGVTEAIQKLFHLSPAEKGFAVASALIGTIMGALGNGPLGDKLGRRESLKITALLFLVSALGCALSWDFYSLVFFRWIGGLGIGAASVLAPMYVAEIAPARWRGRLVMIFQLNIVLGILLAYLSNYLVGRYHLDLTAFLAKNLGGSWGEEWRWKFGVEALPALFFLLNPAACLVRDVRVVCRNSQRLDHIIQQIGYPAAMQSGDGVNCAHS